MSSTLANLTKFAELAAELRKSGIPASVLAEAASGKASSGASAKAKPGPKPKAAKVAKKATKRAAKPKADAAPSPAREATEARKLEELKPIAEFVNASEGVSVSQICEKFDFKNPKAQSVLKFLKSRGLIFMGGDRRFARYAKDEKTAKAASDRDRNASKPAEATEAAGAVAGVATPAEDVLTNGAHALPTAATEPPSAAALS